MFARVIDKNVEIDRRSIDRIPAIDRIDALSSQLRNTCVDEKSAARRSCSFAHAALRCTAVPRAKQPKDRERAARAAGSRFARVAGMRAATVPYVVSYVVSGFSRTFLIFVITAALTGCSDPQPSMTAAEQPGKLVSDDTAISDPHASAAHGDHTPRHGGIVYMKGDLHFEVVLSRSGHHRVYFSDAARAELPAATASEVSLTISNGEGREETVKAEVDEAGESWIAAAKTIPGGDSTVRVAFVVAAEPYWIDVPYIQVVGGRW